jgi:putative membrane protein
MPKQKKNFSLLYPNRKAVPFKKNRTLQIMLAGYIVVFFVLSLRPADRFDWWYESIIPIIVLVLLFVSYNINKLTNMSYFCIMVMLVLHAFGAHYTYQDCPLGSWMIERFGLMRNDFDRITDLSFGLLISIPVLDIIYRRIRIRYIKACVLSIVIILAAAALYEIFEMLSVLILSERSGEVFLGLQGDKWDSQRDMAFALLGSFASMSFCILLRLKKNHKIHMVGYRNN